MIALLLGIASAGEWTTNVLTAASRCYRVGRTHCISDDFSSSSCCEYPDGSVDLDRCINKYKFCTKNLRTTTYKEFTNPSRGCPGANLFTYQHSGLGVIKRMEAPWAASDIGWFCRMTINAKPGMNAKIRVRILGTGDYSVAVYQ